MSLLDKIADKARNTTGKMRGPALVLSSIADYVAGTYDEMTGHKSELGKLAGEDSGMRDYQLYHNTARASMVGEGAAGVAAARYCPSKITVYMLGVDIVTRLSNILSSAGREKSDLNVTGAIGTARTLAYKVAGKLKRSKGEAEVKDEDPFDDADFQVPPAKPAADAEDEDPLASVEQDDTGNKLF